MGERPGWHRLLRDDGGNHRHLDPVRDRTTAALRSRIYCFGVDQNFPVVPAETPGKRAFVLDATFTPVGGRDAADLACANEAADAGLTGEFLALLAKDDEWAAFRFPDPGVPWVRLDGVPINAVGSDPLVGDALASPLNVTSKKRYLGQDFVFTGATTPLDFPMDANCKNWTDVKANTEVAMPSIINFAWFGYSTSYCLSPRGTSTASSTDRRGSRYSRADLSSVASAGEGHPAGGLPASAASAG